MDPAYLIVVQIPERGWPVSATRALSYGTWASSAGRLATLFAAGVAFF